MTATPNVIIRDRGPADLPPIADVLVEVHRSDGYPVEGVDDPIAWLTGAHLRRAWVALRDNDIVGHVAVSEPQPDDAAVQLWKARPENNADLLAIVGRLFVHPNARGNAIGERLMRHVAHYADDNGLRLLLDVMDKDTAAIHLYQRLGWQPIGTTRHPTGRGDTVPATCFVLP